MTAAAWTVLDVDLNELLTYKQAAKETGVPAARLRKWKERGHLEPDGLDERGRPLFTQLAVWRAEALVRRGGQGVGIASRRASRCA